MIFPKRKIKEGRRKLLEMMDKYDIDSDDGFIGV